MTSVAIPRVVSLPGNRWLRAAVGCLLIWLGCALLVPRALGAVSAVAVQDASVLVLNERATGSMVGGYLRYLEDPAGTLTLAQVQAMPERFVQSTSAAPNFSFTSSAYWFYLRVENQHSTQGEWCWKRPIR